MPAPVTGAGMGKRSEPGDFTKSSLILFRLCDLIPTRFVRLWETRRIAR
jgi:hypothetical protein